MLKALLVAINLILVSFVANADVFVWRDANGVLNYSDTPPLEGARNAGSYSVRKANRSSETPARGTGYYWRRSGGGAAASGGVSTLGAGTATSSGTTTTGGATSTSGETTTASGGTATSGGTTTADTGSTTSSGASIPTAPEIEALVGRKLVEEFRANFNQPALRSAPGEGRSDDGLWWVEQQDGSNRVSIVPNGDGEPSALRVHTEPGDFPVPGNSNNFAGAFLAGVGGNLTQQSGGAATNGFEGVTSVWEWSTLFPDDFVLPPGQWDWGAIFEFHQIVNGGQANFVLHSRAPEVSSGEMALRIMGGSPVQVRWYPFGPVVRNVWHRFVAHIKWSSGSDGFAKVWVKQGSGPYVLKVDHVGPTFYPGDGVYLMLNNYHTPHAASSVIHSRVIRHGVQ